MKEFSKYDKELIIKSVTEYQEFVGYGESSLEKFFIKKGLLKEELEKGVWYRIVGNTCGFDYSKFLICYTQKDNNYGFNANGEWSIHLGTARAKYFRKATKEEIEPLLIAEAKRRGLVEGVEFENIESGEVQAIKETDHYMTSELNSLCCGCTRESDWNTKGCESNAYLFHEGKWATPITKTELTIEQIQEKLGYKIKIVE